VELYRELLVQFGERSENIVRELVLVYEKNKNSDPDAIRALANARLPEHERPTRLIPTERLPRTPHGKIDREGLPGLIRGKNPLGESSVSSTAPVDDVLLSVIRTFSRVLGAESVKPDSNFFELGGHSLLAVESILALEEATGRRINITQFLNYPTPRGIAAQIGAQNQQAYDYVYPVSENQTGLPVFIFSASRLSYALKRFKPNWSIYGIQLRWRDDDNKEIRYRSLEDLAAHIVSEIRKICGERQFVLVGSSFPAMVAFEVATQLEARGLKPNLTILIEPTPLYSVRTIIEVDLLARGALKQGQNHYVRWLLLNHPFQARFWGGLHRLITRSKKARLAAKETLETLEDHEDYEEMRATSLWRRYKPPVYSGSTILMVSTEIAWHFIRTWRTRMRNVTVMDSLETDHIKILKDPFMSDEVIPILTREIDSSLQRDRAAKLLNAKGD
jgi:thioesterase domain-containing protein/acyl carrier protein